VVDSVLRSEYDDRNNLSEKFQFRWLINDFQLSHIVTSSKKNLICLRTGILLIKNLWNMSRMKIFFQCPSVDKEFIFQDFGTTNYGASAYNDFRFENRYTLNACTLRPLNSSSQGLGRRIMGQEPTIQEWNIIDLSVKINLEKKKVCKCTNPWTGFQIGEANHFLLTILFTKWPLLVPIALSCDRTVNCTHTLFFSRWFRIYLKPIFSILNTDVISKILGQFTISITYIHVVY